MTQEELNEVLRLHKLWLNHKKGGKKANLCNKNLSHLSLDRASLNGASLNGANIDFSCLPLWCGSLTAHFDDRQLTQIAYHLVKAGLHSKNASEETKRVLSKPDLVEFANGFHRVDECGRIKCEGTV